MENTFDILVNSYIAKSKKEQEDEEYFMEINLMYKSLIADCKRKEMN